MTWNMLFAMVLFIVIPASYAVIPTCQESSFFPVIPACRESFFKKSDMYDTIIIGAGIGGLVCGCYLAKAGLNEDTNKSYKTRYRSHLKWENK